MTTANEIIRGALGKLGIVSPGESVKPGDAEDCLEALNTLLDAWQVERLYAFASLTIDHTVVADTDELEIGPAADIVRTVRPQRFEPGCYYTASGVDYPLEQVPEAQFNHIEFKGLDSFGPCVFTYNPSLPLGKLRFWPNVAAGNVLHLIIQVHVTEFADLTTDYGLSAGYKRALIYSLAEEVGADYEREIPPTVARNAANARRFIKRANHVVPQLMLHVEPRYNFLTE